MLKHRGTYEIMRPQDVGAKTSLVLGKHSGRHALRQRLVELEYEVDEATLDAVFESFKTLTDKQRSVTNDDLSSLMAMHQNTTPAAALAVSP
jgi:2-isopropylmalate synthase